MEPQTRGADDAVGLCGAAGPVEEVASGAVRGHGGPLLMLSVRAPPILTPDKGRVLGKTSTQNWPAGHGCGVTTPLFKQKVPAGQAAHTDAPVEPYSHR